MDSVFSLPALPEVSPGDFARAANLLQKRTGILLGEHKRDMAERTLGLQARAAGAITVTDFLDFLAQRPDAAQWQEFINAFTINHTAFFREAHHFEVLAAFVQTRERPIHVWSAACSTGEEAWSIAITLREHLVRPDYQVRVFASDIDTAAVATARAGIYSKERIKPIAQELLKKYFQRGLGARAGMVRVKPNLRAMVEFEPLNLLDPVWPLDGKLDAIFCRNTLIYFDKETQSQILERMSKVLKPGGLLFAGHSENLTHVTNAFHLRGQTVYEVKTR